MCCCSLVAHAMKYSVITLYLHSGYLHQEFTDAELAVTAFLIQSRCGGFVALYGNDSQMVAISKPENK